MEILGMIQCMDIPVYMIFGSEGILGSSFVGKLSTMPSSTYRLFHFSHKKADITNDADVNPLMEYIRPSVVINCAAINDEDLCQDAKQGAFNVNYKGPQILAEACKKYGSKLVHFSSATVFDGNGLTPYSEQHRPKPVNIHGQSKFSWEQAIEKTIDNFLIIRPGWVFSNQSPSFVPGWIEQVEHDEVSVLDDHVGSPTYAIDLIDATMDLLEKDAKGIFHFSNENAATRQAMAEVVMDLTGLKRKISVLKPESQKFFKAPTPKYTVLSTKKYKQLTGKTPRQWQDALKHCLFIMHKYRP